MKKFVLLWICALGVCLVGCSDDDTPEQLPDPELTLAPDAPIAFPAKGGNVEIAVTTNMETWSAVSDQEWCKVAASAGKFTVSARRERDAGTDAGRHGDRDCFDGRTLRQP